MHIQYFDFDPVGHKMQALSLITGIREAQKSGCTRPELHYISEMLGISWQRSCAQSEETNTVKLMTFSEGLRHRKTAVLDSGEEKKSFEETQDTPLLARNTLERSDNDYQDKKMQPNLEEEAAMYLKQAQQYLSRHEQSHTRNDLQHAKCFAKKGATISPQKYPRQIDAIEENRKLLTLMTVLEDEPKEKPSHCTIM
jgi:hypothetical protein